MNLHQMTSRVHLEQKFGDPFCFLPVTTGYDTHCFIFTQNIFMVNG